MREDHGANMLDGRLVEGGRVFETRGGARIEVRPAGPVPAAPKLVFRPQDATLVPASRGTDVLAGTITRREFLGSTVRYGIALGGDEIAVDSAFHGGDALVEVGAAAGVVLAPGAALVLGP